MHKVVVGFFLSFTAIRLELGKCQSLGGSGPTRECKLSADDIWEHIDAMANAHQLINYRAKNEHDCFYYALASGFMHSSPHYANFNLDKLAAMLKRLHARKKKFCPVQIKDVDKFEAMLPLIRINIFLQEEGVSVYPVYVSHKRLLSVEDIDKYATFNLLLVRIADTESDASSSDSDDVSSIVEVKNTCEHYVYIKNLAKYVRKYYGNGGYESIFICENCLTGFSRAETLIKHQDLCLNNDPQRVAVPEKGSTIQFRNVNNQSFIPITVFFDFEASMEDSKSVQKCFTCEKINSRTRCPHNTRCYIQQKPMLYYLVFVDNDLNIIYKAKCSGTDREVMDSLYSELKLAAEEIDKKLSEICEIRMSKAETRAYAFAKRCYLCNEEYTNKKG